MCQYLAAIFIAFGMTSTAGTSTLAIESCFDVNFDILRLPGLSEAFLTGGIPPGINLPCSADMAYHSLFR